MKNFFILGCYRSGTSLLRTSLNASTKIFIPEETKFLVYLLSKTKDQIEISKIIEILKKQKWEDIPSKSEIKEIIRNSKSSDEILFNFIFSIANKSNLEAIGDKTPYYIKILDKILSFPRKPKVIAMLRDPRDVYCSVRNLHIGYGRSPGLLAIDWYLRNITILDHKESIFICRYEDFVQEPRKELEKITNFLDVSFDEEMLSPQNSKAAKSLSRQEHHKSLLNSINTKSYLRYKTELNKIEIRIIDLIAGPLMHSFGYKTMHPKRKLVDYIFIFIILIIEMPYSLIKTKLIRLKKL